MSTQSNYIIDNDLNNKSNIKLLLTNQTIKRISNFTSALFIPPRPLTHKENEHLIKFIKHDTKVDQTLPVCEFVLATSLEFYNLIVSNNKPSSIGLDTSEDDTFDEHEYLKKVINSTDVNDSDNIIGVQLHNIVEIKKKAIDTQDKKLTNLSRFARLPSLLEFIKALNPKAIHKKAYLVLDTKYARFTSNNTKLSWDYVNSLTEGDNSTNSTSNIRDIVSMRIYSTVIRQFESPLQRGTILVEEFASQAFIAPNGRKFHYVGLLNDIRYPYSLTERNRRGTYSGLQPDAPTYNKYELLSGYKFNEGVYNFHTPITTFDTITLSFGDPFNVLSIPKNVINGCTMEYFRYEKVSATPTYTFSVPGNYRDINTDFMGEIIVNCNELHYFNTNIYSLKISGFTTDNPVADDIFITWINNNEFTAVYVLDSNRLMIRPLHIKQPGPGPLYIQDLGDVTLTSLVGNPLPFTITFDGYRSITNIEFTYIDTDINN
jgi:hypothetical protein